MARTRLAPDGYRPVTPASADSVLSGPRPALVFCIVGCAVGTGYIYVGPTGGSGGENGGQRESRGEVGWEGARVHGPGGDGGGSCGGGLESVQHEVARADRGCLRGFQRRLRRDLPDRFGSERNLGRPGPAGV